MDDTYILIHGLGQNETSWNMVEAELNNFGLHIEKPNLYSLMNGRPMDYDTLFQVFADYCNRFDGTLHLCGLSLGGILALDYAKKFPNHVNSLILIGVPYKIPKVLFKIQEMIFHLMPSNTFDQIGCSKKDFISLVKSMGDLNITEGLDRVSCKTLILCGAGDRQNRKSACVLNEKIKGSAWKNVDHASHEVNVDNPKELSKIIDHFYAGFNR